MNDLHIQWPPLLSSFLEGVGRYSAPSLHLSFVDCAIESDSSFSSIPPYFKKLAALAALPVITVIGIQIGGLIAFSIITETVFQWPGMGQLFIQSVQFADIPVMAAYLVMVSFIFVAINFFVDLLQRLPWKRIHDV